MLTHHVSGAVKLPHHASGAVMLPPMSFMLPTVYLGLSAAIMLSQQTTCVWGCMLPNLLFWAGMLPHHVLGAVRLPHHELLAVMLPHDVLGAACVAALSIALLH